MNFPPVQERSVLVTGCSTGIGLATARFLRARGWRVWPTARKPADLERLRTEGFDPLELDVGDSDSVKRAIETILQRGDGRLGGLVNNAGYGQPGAVEDLTRDALRRQFEVNVFGLQELTNGFIPVFRRQGFGRIVNVGSVVGRIALPFMGAYSASKFALAALTSALRVELRGTGIAVSLIEPGPIATAFSQNAVRAGRERLRADGSAFASFYQEQLRRESAPDDQPGPFCRPPEDVARVIAHALESRRPRRRYPVTLPAHFGAFMARHAPEWVIDALLAARSRRKV